MKYKVSSNIVAASELLFRTIIKNIGGSTEVGERVGVSRQLIYNFETYGYIPIKQVYSIAKDLKLKVWHLAYHKLVEVFGSEVPKFETLVNGLNLLSDSDKEKIIKVYKSKR